LRKEILHHKLIWN